MKDNTKTKLADELLITALRIDPDAVQGIPEKLESLFGTQNTSLVKDKLHRLSTRNPANHILIENIIKKYEKNKGHALFGTAEKSVSDIKRQPRENETFSLVVAKHIFEATGTKNIKNGNILAVDLAECIKGMPLNEFLLPFFIDAGYPELPVHEKTMRSFEFNNRQWIPESYNSQDAFDEKLIYQIEKKIKRKTSSLLKQMVTIFRYHMSKNPLRVVSYFNLAILYQRLFITSRKEDAHNAAVSYLDQSWKMLEHARARLELVRRLEKTDAIGQNLQQLLFEAKSYIDSHKKIYTGFILKKYFYALWFLFFDSDVPFAGKGADAAYNSKNDDDFIKNGTALEKEQIFTLTKRYRNKSLFEQYKSRLTLTRQRLGRIIDQKQYSQIISDSHLDEIKNYIENQMLGVLNYRDDSQVPYTYLDVRLIPGTKSGRITFTSYETNIFKDIAISEIRKGFGFILSDKSNQLSARFSNTNHSVLTGIHLHEKLFAERINNKEFTPQVTVKIHTDVLKWFETEQNIKLSQVPLPTDRIPQKIISPGKLVISRETHNQLDKKISSRFGSFDPKKADFDKIQEKETGFSFDDQPPPGSKDIELLEYDIIFSDGN